MTVVGLCNTDGGTAYPLDVLRRTEVVLAIILICLAVALGLGGLLLEGLKWLLIVALVLLIAGFISAAIGRGRNRQL